jgi:hypothetical protein
MKSRTNLKKMIYIAGNARSGSTLLGTILAEAENSLAIGETIWFWNTKSDQQICSCGQTFQECQVFGKILSDYLHAANSLQIEVPKRGYFRKNYYALLFLLGFDGLLTDQYIQTLRTFFEGLFHETGANILIEDSKSFAYLCALQKMNILDIQIIHIVRDPRAVAYSWQRKKSWQRNKDLVSVDSKFTILPYPISARQWLTEQFLWWIVNRFSQLNKYMVVRYEDFVSDPQKIFKEICQNIGVQAESPFISNTEFKISRENHLIASNPSAPRVGLNTIKFDSEWKEKMPFWAKLLVTLICWPMMLIYGYPIFGDHA